MGWFFFSLLQTVLHIFNFKLCCKNIRGNTLWHGSCKIYANFVPSAMFAECRQGQRSVVMSSALSSLSSALEIITRLCHHPFAKLFYWFPAGQWWLELAPLWFLWIFQWPRSGLAPPRSDHWQRKSHPLQESNYHQGAICGFNSLHIICSMVHWGQLNTTR